MEIFACAFAIRKPHTISSNTLLVIANEENQSSSENVGYNVSQSLPQWGTTLLFSATSTTPLPCRSKNQHAQNHSEG